MSKINLKKIEDYSLNEKNIKKILGKNIKIIEYSQLKYINNIDDIFDDEGRCILFFATESNTIGHWECLIKQDNRILFFDSYGLGIDKCKNYVSKKLLIKLNEYPNYLTDILNKSGYNIFHNAVRYQKMEGDITTCGRHCCLRLLNEKMNGLQYRQFMNSLINFTNTTNYDQAVSKYLYSKYKF